MELTNRPIRNEVAAVFSSGMLKVPHLNALLGVARTVVRPDVSRADSIDYVVGWGTKPTARQARAYARKTGLPYVAIEDGFLRSAGSASAKLPPISVVLDDVGVYYEAARPSRIEALIRASDERDPQSQDDIETAFEAFLHHRLTKYNTVAPSQVDRHRPKRSRVLLVDQVFADQSIAGGLASARTFRGMIESALAAFPAESIGVKIHPDVLAGRARGYIDKLAVEYGLNIHADMSNPHDLLEEVDMVWTVTSQLGLEAVFKGIPVRCFGVPFYAGWGLTEDTPDNSRAQTALARRGAARKPLDIFAAAYHGYANYADPVGGRPIGLPDAIERLVDWRARAEANRQNVICVGWPLDKRATARAYFGDGGNRIEFATAATAIGRAKGSGSRILSWRNAGGRLLAAASGDHGITHACVSEAPLTVLDEKKRGSISSALWLDVRSTAPAGTDDGNIERVLNNYPFTDDQKDRAILLMDALCQVGHGKGADPDADAIAVLGERFGERGGSRPVKSNLDFLKAVHAANPGKSILYAEHPDVACGDAPGRVSKARLSELAGAKVSLQDIVFGKVPVAAVHTVASNGGFAALMTGHRVVCWGAPFYAGWGLTEDQLEIPGRKRRLTLSELVAGALIVHSLYVDARTGVPCKAEDLVRRIALQHEGSLPRSLQPRPVWFEPIVSVLHKCRAVLLQGVQRS